MYDSATESFENNFSLPLKVGGYFDFTPVVGRLSNYFGTNLAGGIEVEFNLPIPVASESPAAFLLDNLGVSGRISMGGYTVKDDVFSGMMNMKFLAGVFTIIPIGSSNFSFIPDLSFGLLLNMPKLNPDYLNDVSSVYCDQCFQLSLGVRYSHWNFVNGKLEFELAPEYGIALEKGGAIQYIGFRAGVLYNLE